MNSNAGTRILLVDDHEIVRRGLRALLESQPGWEVCGEAADGRMAVRMAAELAPNVVVMDLGMPLLNGFEAARRIISRNRKTRVLVLSMHESEQLVREVLAAGASGYVLKSDAGRDLIAAVKAIRSGDPFFKSRLAARIYDSEFRPNRRRTRLRDELTNREREVLQLLAEGKANKAVASLLDISVKTVETHRSSIMHKLKIRTVADLVRYAIRNGFTSA